MLRAALLSDPVLFLRQLVPDGFRGGLLVVARIDAQFGEQLYLRLGDMAVAVRIPLKIILMILLSGIVVFQRTDLDKELLAASALELRNTLDCLLRAFIGIVYAGLVLAAAVIALPVLHRGVNHKEVGQ